MVVLSSSTLITFSSPVDWVMLGLCMVLGLVAARVGLRAWTGRHAFLQMYDPPPGWRRSAPMWRGYVRTLGVLAVAWWCLVLAVLIGTFAPDRQSAATWIAGALALLAALWIFVLLPAIVLFARPRHLIPPAVRGQPGALSEWRQTRRTGPARRGSS
jgi:cytochrome c biogenesis protein CcdA